MCGIAGLFDTNLATTADALEARAAAMAARLVHRGPDDDGVWCDAASGVAFGFRRLSIIDLSSNGHQPMMSGSGRYVGVYNGELYNFGALRAALDAKSAVAWRGSSDTEVLLAGVDAWGVDGLLERAVGMFAFAVWDRERRQLVLARDRLGEKPLYWSERDGLVTFASEVRALLPELGGPRIDDGALALYLRHGYVPGPRSIYEGVQKLPPGCTATIDAGGCRVARYWSVRDAALEERAKFDSLDDAADELETMLADSTAAQMIADVPVGAFLSGGADSSLVVALMQRHATQPVRTYSIGFREQRYDEAPFAAAVARHLGTDHTELYVTAEQGLETARRLPSVFDEPFGDASAIPMLLVSELARRDVTVALSGDGGDELFGGYERYHRAQLAWRVLGPVPGPVRRAAGRLATRRSAAQWDRLARPTGRRPGDRIHKLAALAGAADVEGAYNHVTAHWLDPAGALRSGREPASALTDRTLWPVAPTALERMMALDAETYLPDDILVKVDRSTMAASLEARAPMLDHRIVEWAFRLPVELRVHRGERKRVVKSVLYRHVPPTLVDRPKRGFEVPMGAWLRGPLRSWADELLSVDRLRADGLFDPDVVRGVWREHQSGDRTWTFQLWDVVAFQAWLASQRAEVGAS